MCTSIVLFNKSKKWPVIIGSNRDESLNRGSKFPSRHWKKHYPNIIAGKDEEKKGSWIGVNDNGLVAIIHNRKLDLNVERKTSRGKVILEILKYTKVNDSLKYLKDLDRYNYNNFNLLIASYCECYWIKHDINNNHLIIQKIEKGLSIITDKDLNDRNDKKIDFYFQLFSSLNIPSPSENNWEIWKENLTNHDIDFLQDNQKICFTNHEFNYGTRSSSLIAIPNPKKTNEKLVFKSTNTYPTKNNYIDVKI